MVVTGAPILVVDDDVSVTASLALLLKQHGYRPLTAHAADEALDLVRREQPRLVVQDLNFSRSTTGEDGLELLSAIRTIEPRMPVILITAWGSISLAVEGMKRGAADFITKPWSNAHVLQSIQLALDIGQRLEGAGAAATRAELDDRGDFAPILGSDPKIIRLLDLIARVAPTDASVLITGESGTGKELVAEAIHRNSRRATRLFVKVNLGGISSTLFESEMFGHVRGAFTDARNDRKGRFEVADGGTIFLDEIGELDPSAQVKLLRVLQDRTYEVLGSSRSRSVDVRIVSATNRNLAEMAQRGDFREDLYYRLNLITIALPPLRERRGDIPQLVHHFLRACSEAHRTAPASVSARAMEWLKAQSWPGNIRQLRQTVERAVLLHGGGELDREHFLDLRDDPRSGNASLPDAGAMTLDEIERAMIVKCMTHYSGNVTRVAEALGLSRAALYRRMEKYGITEG